MSESNTPSAPTGIAARRRPTGAPLPPPALVAAAGWVLPGLGYWLVRERGRALVAGITILLLFVSGLLIGGVRVIDVPGYDGNGVDLRTKRGPIANRNIIQNTFDKAWYIPQLMVGPVTLGMSYFSVQLAQAHEARATAKLWDIGTLYTAVAGMLNLFILIDAAHRSAKAREKDPRLNTM
ncbi:MAG: hypothetical protein QM770_05410 [Tepidisphaeraceae bacterium]